MVGARFKVEKSLIYHLEQIYIYIDTHTCMYKILVSRKENIIE